MPSIEVVALALVAIAALAGMAFVASRSGKTARELSMAALKEMRAFTQQQLVLGGAHPHLVDPERFGPTGMSREDEAKQTEAANQAAEDAATAQEVARSQEEQALREAEASFLALNPSARTGYGGRHINRST